MKSTTTLLYVCAALLVSACAGNERDQSPEAIGETDRSRLSTLGDDNDDGDGDGNGGGGGDPAPLQTGVPDLGVEASLHGKPIFTTTNDPTKMGFEWTKDISTAPVDPSSTALLRNGMGRSDLQNVVLHPDFGTSYQGVPIGIPYQIVPGNQQRLPISFFGAPAESDPGPYPFPPNVPIEGGSNSTGDRHVLVLDRDAWKLYETFDTHPVTQGGKVVGWQAYSGAIFDLNTGTYRPQCWTSADAAGLPIFPGLVRYDEVFEQGVITHALRFTLKNTRRAFIKPARHFASQNANSAFPPMGMRIRLRANYPIDNRFTPEVQVILRALKKYGLILADNGSNLYMTGTHDTRWNDASLGTMKTVKASDFEVVRMDQGQIVTFCQ